jgi:hypothetical protein
VDHYRDDGAQAPLRPFLVFLCVWLPALILAVLPCYTTLVNYFILDEKNAIIEKVVELGRPWPVFVYHLDDEFGNEPCSQQYTMKVVDILGPGTQS